MLKRIPINQLLDQVGTLPPMPRVAQRAMEIIRDPNSDMKDLAGVIKLDQAMSSLILRWVNSGYFSLRNHVPSIEQAVAYLGHRTVQDLLLTASVANFMNKPVPGYSLEKGDLWKHSIGLAAGARLIVKDLQPRLAEDAYYVGLFCDVGKLVFETLLRNLNFDLSAFGERSFDDVENGLFGYDHATVGAAMVQRWNLPEHISLAIKYHHTPAQAQGDSRLLAYAAHAADAVMNMFGIGLGRDALQYKLDPATVDELKFNEQSLDNLYERVVPVIQEADNFLAGR
ncbi:MAG TPA: HDOD domain-containing protein [Anaerolineaceae bacterium]